MNLGILWNADFSSILHLSAKFSLGYNSPLGRGR